jgi:hypothetical protein
MPLTLVSSIHTNNGDTSATYRHPDKAGNATIATPTHNTISPK